MADCRWPRFAAAVRDVFSSWTALQLAVANGWGGRNSSAKAEALVAEVLRGFSPEKAAEVRGTRPPSGWTSEQLAEFLAEQVECMFSIELEDDSEVEVAGLVVALFEACANNNFALADTLGQQQVTSVAIQSCQNTAKNAPPSSFDDDSDDSDDSDNSEAEEEGRTGAATIPQNDGPNTNGWVMVERRKK